MGTDNALSKGIDLSGARIYPSDWLCKRCGRQLKLHLTEPPNEKWWCFSEQDYKKDGLVAYQWFDPVDNLTYVEVLATAKKL